LRPGRRWASRESRCPEKHWDSTSALGVDGEPLYDAPRAGDVRHSFASIDRAREQLGYIPTVNIDEGLGRTIAYFRERGRAPARLRVAV
jgi:nucleoside-diphosphate-sugar epimerase